MNRGTARSHTRRSGVVLSLAATLVTCLAAAACASKQGDNRIVLSGVRPAGERLAQAQALAQRAQRQVEREKPEEAIATYRDALRAYDEFPAAWNNLGVLLMEEERFLEAADAFASASERAPADPRPVYNLGLTWERASYLDEALDHYLRALERDPRYLPAIRGAVRAEELLGVSSDATADRVRMALMLERDPVWRAYFEQQRIRVDAARTRQSRDAVIGTE